MLGKITNLIPNLIFGSARAEMIDYHRREAAWCAANGFAADAAWHERSILTLTTT